MPSVDMSMQRHSIILSYNLIAQWCRFDGNKAQMSIYGLNKVKVISTELVIGGQRAFLSATMAV